MKAWLKILLGISLSFMCVFSCIGYAAVSAPMRVFGTVKNAIPYGLFITNIETTNETNIDKNVVSHVEYTTTVDSDISRSRSTGTVVYRITVLNNTNLTYTYRGIYYQSNLSGYNGNVYISETPGRSYIGVECSLDDKSTEEKKVEPGRELTFTVTYTVGSGRPSGTDWRTLINYQFGINVDGEREALEVIENKFLNILNTPSTYEQLIDYNEIPRDEALAKARADAIELAVAAGAIRETVEIIDAEDVPLQYYPGNTARVKIKAAGDLA